MIALILASVEAGAEEASKTPFYVLGGAAAVWAVILAAIGLAKPDFPSKGAYPIVIGVTLMVVLGAMAGTVLTS